MIQANACPAMMRKEMPLQLLQFLLRVMIFASLKSCGTMQKKQWAALQCLVRSGEISSVPVVLPEAMLLTA